MFNQIMIFLLVHLPKLVFDRVLGWLENYLKWLDQKKLVLYSLMK